MASKKDDFPNLRDEDWVPKSDPDPKYNCIAFAAGRTDVYWWPDNYPDPDSEYWPSGIVREETVEAIAALFRSQGFEDCADGSLEEGYEKVVIYAKEEEPTHAAKQLPDGRWISKLGPEDDIEYRSLECLNGPCYGQAAKFLKKAVAGDAGPNEPSPSQNAVRQASPP
jgi:hypothetical protein